MIWRLFVAKLSESSVIAATAEVSKCDLANTGKRAK
jgi:hypothetical protein